MGAILECVQLGMASSFRTIYLTPRGVCGNEEPVGDKDEVKFPESVEFLGVSPISFALKC